MKNKGKVLFLLVISTLVVNFFYQDTKTVEISYKEYKEGNNNLVLDKILRDNELKQEIPHMFNYASNGNYFDRNNWEDLNDPEYITEGLYSNKDEDGTTYYYRGDIDNNNIVFGTYDEDYYVYGNRHIGYYQTLEVCTIYSENMVEEYPCNKIKLASKGDKMYWKIVRVNGDGSLRLIYNGPGLKDVGIIIGSFSNENISGPIGASQYNLRDDPKYGGYTYDNGVDSIVKKEVDTWYNNTLGSNSSYDSKVIFGRFCNDTSGYNYNGEGLFSNANRLGWNNSSDIAPTFICPETAESYGGSYKLKAGLITADEVVFAGELLYVTGNSYLNIGASDENYWTMTPLSDEYNWNMSSFLDEIIWSTPSFIRPVINIKTDNMTLIGDGTLDNPYRLEEVTKNNYKGTVTIEEGSSIDNVTAFEETLNLNGVAWTSNDESIARIENGKILGIKEGTTNITGVSSDGLTTYEIVVNVINNPVTNSMIYVGIGIILILVLGTALYTVYRIKTIVKED